MSLAWLVRKKKRLFFLYRFYKIFNPKKIIFLGFNHNFNSLTSKSELAEAYSSFVSERMTVLYYIISFLSVYAPFIRKIPTARIRDIIIHVKLLNVNRKS